MPPAVPLGRGCKDDTGTGLCAVVAAHLNVLTLSSPSAVPGEPGTASNEAGHEYPAPPSDRKATADDRQHQPAATANRFGADGNPRQHLPPGRRELLRKRSGPRRNDHRAMAVRVSRKPGNVTAMSQAHGQWLRQQRQARGWSVLQMVRELRKAAESTGDKLPGREGMIVMIHRWERDGSGISERYRLHYSTAFKTPIDRFGDPAILDALHANERSRISTGHAGIAKPHPAQDRMQAALNQIGDPAKRDQMCFMLGYLSALMTSVAPAPHHCAASGDTAEALPSR